MATIKDVAKKAHVSVATVSRVINRKGYVNDETREIVLKAIRELNYVPNELARSLFQKKSSIIAVLVPHLSSDFFAELLENIESITIDLNYRLMVCITQDDPEKESKYLKIFDQYNIDGLILISNTHRINDYKKLNIPIIEVDHNLAEDIPSVSANNYQGGKLAAEKLISLGCKKIIHFRGPHMLLTVQDRSLGFQSVLRNRNIFNFSYDLAFKEPDRSDIQKVINSNLDCDGIFCDSDLIAINVIQCLKQAGRRVPEDVQVIGFDDVSLSKLMEPKLSTIKQPTQKIAEYAVNSLMKLINREELDTSHRNIDVELTERETTRK